MNRYDRLGTRLLALTAALVMTGCVTMQSHDKVATEVSAARRTGGIEAAIAQVDATWKTDDDRKALLYSLERGELLRLANRYDDSTKTLLTADAQVKSWEEIAKHTPEKLLSQALTQAAAATISERLKPYEGQDYEKVMLTTVLALNRVALGDWDNARVDVKRTHEREAVIAEFRAKELVKAEEEAKAKGATSGTKELDGYPVETLNDPEVLQLRNGYQNALSHYLSGFLYEVLNEPGLAAPGYRKAIELKPHTPLLEEGLRGLDKRTGFTHRARQQMTDVLFLIETGDAPARKPQQFNFPVPIGGKVIVSSVSFPVIKPSNSAPLGALMVGNASLKAEPVVDFNVMARRALKDEMPTMMFRTMTRAIAKGVVQDKAQSLGLIGGLIAAGGSVMTEQSDDRLWRSLPERVYVARGYLPPGEHRVSVGGRELPQTVSVKGQYAVVPLRLYNDSTLVGSAAIYGELRAAAVQVPAAAVQTVRGTATPSKAPSVLPNAPSKPAATTKRPAAAAADAEAGKGAKP